MQSRLQANPPAPDRVPTLTEVLDAWQAGRPSVLPVLTEVSDDPKLQTHPPPVEVPFEVPVVSAALEVAGAVEPEPDLAPAPALPEPALPSAVYAADGAQADAELLQRVMAVLAPRLDILLEVRLNQMLGPALTQAVHSLVQGVRQDLSPALQEVASQAVAQVLAQGRVPATPGLGGLVPSAQPALGPPPASGTDPRAG
jgi:hypothetical protein